MSEARALRDRRLIQRTAALLSEDYPLDQLVERTCDALSSELDAAITFVALGGDDHQLKVEASVSRSDGYVPDVGPQSAAINAFRSNESFLDADGTNLAVPIMYRDQVTGVVALRAIDGTSFDEQDERLVTAIARYLAIAIRHQRMPGGAQLRSRSPKIAIVVVVALAVLVTALIISVTSIRVTQSRVAQREVAQTRVRAIVDQMNSYVLIARQLAASTANIAGPIRGDRKQVESALIALLESARIDTVYGIGAWYEPYVFDGKTRWYGPYAHFDKHHRAIITYEWMRPSYNFQNQPWYRLGASALGQAKFTDPYFDTDHVYVTAARAFSTNGRLAGVVSVDSILPTLRTSMPVRLPPGFFVAVTTGNGSVLLTSDDSRLTAAQLPKHVTTVVGSDAEHFSGSVPYTGWNVQLWESREAFDAESRRLWLVAGIALAGIWIAAALTIFVAIRSGRHVRRAMALEEQQGLLEREIAERVRAEEKLRRHAFQDELTGLPNRAFFIAQLDAYLTALRLDPEATFAVLFIDIDRFNLINDSLGHVTGDRLLTEFGARLAAHARAGDVVARMGGDEFVLLARVSEHAEARRRASEVVQALRHPFTISGLEFFVTASIGIAMSDPNYGAPEETLRDADVAMYEAKRAGRATFRMFDRSMQADSLERLALETDLRRALERDEIYVEFQPLMHLSDGTIAGFEALARWKHPTRGAISPDVFIRIAEQSGMIVEIDERILSKSTLTAKTWLEENPDIFVAVNFSAAHLARMDDLGLVRGALEVSGLPAKSLKIEITESAVMENAEKSLALLLGLREIGVTVVIDDFGTGYSSLSHLQRLPVEEIKIDRSFVGTMIQNEKSAEIVRAILAISKTLHLSVTAEGVETQEQADRLQRLKVEYAQGMHFGMSVSTDMALRILRTRLKRSIRV